MPLFNIAGKYSDALGSAFQRARDFVLDRVAPRPEALFIKAMTGGYQLKSNQVLECFKGY